MNRNQFIRVFLAIPLVFLAVYAIGDVQKSHQKLELKQVQLKSIDLQLKTLEGRYNQALQEVEQGKGTQAELNDANGRLQQLEQQKADLESQLQAKKAASRVYAASVSGCGDNQYANYIYMHESGCQLWNPNPESGACGLGQAWPCSKMPCGQDYACQNAFFNNYAITRYGSWYAAYLHWLGAHSW